MYNLNRITAFVIFLGSLLAAAGTSHAQQANEKRVRVAVMSHPKRGKITTERAAWLHRLFHWALRQNKQLAVVPRDEMKRKLIAARASLSRGDKARIRVLRTFIQKAKKLYQLRRYRFTLKALGIADKLAAKVRSYLNEPELIRDLYLYRSLAYMGLRNGLKTREYVMRTVQFDPRYIPSSGSIPSSYITYYKVIRSWLLRQPTYQFALKTVPSQAKVFVNFRYKGVTPISIKVTRGKHLVRIEKAGYKTWERLANFNPKQLKKRRVVRASVSLKRDPRSLSLDNIPLFAKGADIDDNIMDKLEKICQRLNVKHLLVTAPRRSSQYFLRIASFQRGVRKIRYKTVQIGKNRQRNRARIVAYTKAVSLQIAPAPRPKTRPTPRRPRRVAVRTRREITQKVEPPITKPRQIQPRQIQPRQIQPRQIQPRRSIPEPRRQAFRRPKEAPRMIRRAPPQAPKAATPAHKTWWFWAVTLGATGAVVATVVVVLSQTGPPPTATLIITTRNPTGPGN